MEDSSSVREIIDKMSVQDCPQRRMDKSPISPPFRMMVIKNECDDIDDQSDFSSPTSTSLSPEFNATPFKKLPKTCQQILLHQFEKARTREKKNKLTKEKKKKIVTEVNEKWKLQIETCGPKGGKRKPIRSRCKSPLGRRASSRSPSRSRSRSPCRSPRSPRSLSPRNPGKGHRRPKSFDLSNLNLKKWKKKKKKQKNNALTPLTIEEMNFRKRSGGGMSIEDLEALVLNEK